MGRRGPKKSAELAINPSGPVGNDRNPPKSLENNELAIETWHRSVDQLVLQGTYQDCDRFALERHAICAALIPKYAAVCFKNGGYQTTKTGYTQVSAELSCFLKVSSELRSLERALGLTPESRRNMNLGTVEEDELSGFLNEAG